MKKIVLLFSLVAQSFFLSANVAPVFGPVANTDIIQASGQNIILINNVDDGDAGSVQNITFTAVSSDPSKVAVDSVSFNKNNKFAVLYVSEKGVIGSSTISITAKDDGGAPDTYSANFTVNVIKSLVTGATLDIFDNPTNNRDFPVAGEIPMWTHIVPTFEPNEIKVLPAEVAGINTNTFIAQEYGYFIPPATGIYGFFNSAASKGWLYLSPDDNPTNAKEIASTVATGGYTLVGVNLVAGKKYYIMANFRNQFNSSPYMKVSYQYKTTPTGSMSAWFLIGGNECVPYNDKAIPSTPLNFKIVTKGITDALISWKPSTDDIKLIGYNVYIDGVLYNGTPATDTSMLISGLTKLTGYSVVVRAVDYFNKMSRLSNTINFTTYDTDAIKPSAPTGFKTLNATGVVVKISWNKAVDGQTEIRGYNVYVNSVKFNTAFVIDTFCNITGLIPKTSYNIKVIAVDAGYNQSDSSALYVAKTIGFDPLNNSDGVAKGELSFKIEPVCKMIGLGLQVGPGQAAGIDVKEFYPGSIRWGGIDANAESLSSFSSGGWTYADHLKAANDLNAYACYSLGTGPTTDFYKDTNTFKNFIEYLAGAPGTTWGAKRNSEGYPDLMTGNKGIIVEFGNEVWAGPAHKSVFTDGGTYALWCRLNALRMKRTAGYKNNKSKFFFSYSGRSVDNFLSWNNTILPGDTGQVEWLSVSGYVGGNMNYDPLIETDRSEIQYYKNSNKSIALKYIDAGIIQTQRKMILNTGRIMPMYMYEGNLTTPSYKQKIGQGILFVDYYLTMCEKGVAVPIVFCLGPGNEWGIIQSGKRMPIYHMSALFNKNCKDKTILKTAFTTSDYMTDGSNKPIGGYAPVGCHTYTDSGHYRIVMFNRDFEKDYVVRIDLPDGMAFSTNATIHRIVSASDFSSDDVIQTAVPITNFADSMLITVPKYSMLMIAVDGPVQAIPAQPIYNTTYQKITKFSIETEDNRYHLTWSDDFLQFKVNYEPANAYYTDLKWDLLENNESAFFNFGTLRLKGSGYSGGNGSMILKATTQDGSKLTDQKTITITGQSIEDYKDDQGVIIYPNPAKESISVITPEPDAVVTILSPMGSTVLSRNITGNETTIDVSSLASGIYMITVDMNGTRSTRKIIKE